MKLLLLPTVPTGLSFFVPIPAFQKEISRQDPLEATIANSFDPRQPRFCPSAFAIPFPKVDRCRQPIASKKSWVRTLKQRPIDGRGVHLASKTDHF